MSLANATETCYCNPLTKLVVIIWSKFVHELFELNFATNKGLILIKRNQPVDFLVDYVWSVCVLRLLYSNFFKDGMFAVNLYSGCNLLKKTLEFPKVGS